MTDDRTDFPQDPADRPEVLPRLDPAEVLARLGCDPSAIADEEAAEGVARALVVAIAEEDTEAIDIVLGAYIDEARDGGEALVRALLAAARIACNVAGLAKRTMSLEVTDVMAVDAEFNRRRHEHARAAVAAILDDTPAEDLDPEVDATRASMVREAFILAAVDGAGLDPAERIDLELEALLDEAERDEARRDDLVDPNDVTPGGLSGH
ncbi:MAG: hypothetical protein ACKOZL_01910 [Actinomycetes bacterium]